MLIVLAERHLSVIYFFYLPIIAVQLYSNTFQPQELRIDLI